MTDRMPPLNSLKVFEAAARHMSFKKAAEELHVTPAAVSHQLSQLETLLGIRLFTRYNQKIALTPAARVCLPQLQQGLECLRDSIDRLRQHARTETLTVTASPSFATRWLMPRLHRFIVSNPGIEINVAIKANPETDIRPEGGRALGNADLALVYGNHHYDGAMAEPFLPVSITPLCSPSLLEQGPPLESPHGLAAFPLLHGDRETLYGYKPLWTVWLEAAGADEIPTHDAHRFAHPSLAIEAAADGMGIMAGNPLLAEPEMRAGRLTAPFELRVPLAHGYQLFSDEASCRRSSVTAFRRWLLDEAAACAA